MSNLIKRLRYLLVGEKPPKKETIMPHLDKTQSEPKNEDQLRRKKRWLEQKA